MMINKRLIAMMGDSKRYIARNVALQWVALLANIAMIFAVSAFLAGLVYGQGSLSAALLVLLGALIVRFFCTRGAASASYNASRTVKKTLRAAIYEKLLRLGGSYTQAVPTAEVLQLAGEGVEQLETYFGAYLPQFFYAMLAPLTLFIALAPVSLRAAVILMICVPLIPVSIVAVQKFAKKLLGKYWGQYAALGDSFLENLQGLTTLKIYQADEARHAAMNREAEHFRKVTMKVLTMQLNSIIVMDVIAYGGAALGIAVAAKEFAAGRVGLQGALCILLLSADFFLPMRALGSYFHVAMNGMAASDKIFKLLDLPEGDARTAEIGTGCAIACRDLHFGYTAEKETLYGLNLDFPQGSFTALVGESGCGKSTVTAVFAGHGVPLADADQISREILLPGSPLLPQLAARFGGDILKPDGTLDRRLLADRAFATPEGKAALDSLTHPAIVARIRAAKQAAQAAGASLFVLDGAVIVGTAAQAECDRLCVVTAPFETSVARIVARDGISPEMATRRLNAQTSEQTLTAQADYTLHNDAGLEALQAAAARLCERLQAEGGVTAAL